MSRTLSPICYVCCYCACEDFVVERRIAAEAGAAVAALRVELALEGDEDVGEVVREETRKEIGAEMEVDAKLEVNAVVE